MFSELGASFKFPESEFKPYFPHPKAENENERVYALLDICHMLKLVRNTLAEGGILIDNENKQIRWQYFVDLQKLQEAEGLRLANKLKKVHIHWWQQKMKVNLAVQVFSSSVADALEFCSRHLADYKEFKDCEATVKFIRIFDNLFDVLNSRNPFAKGNKAAMHVGNKIVWNSVFDE
ncbi:unnamed protein product, partial [Meganyctiphanes norvegica]